jgi:hypothetical protein
MVKDWNGKSFLEFFHTGDLSLDASKQGWYKSKPGIGAFNFATNEFFSVGVPVEMEDWDICDLELAAHILACHTWASAWHGRKVSMLTDNEACQFFMLHGWSHSPWRLSMGHTITGLQFKSDFRIFSARISTTQNILSDALSHEGEPGKLELFFSECFKHSVSPVRLQVSPEAFNLVQGSGSE